MHLPCSTASELARLDDPCAFAGPANLRIGLGVRRTFVRYPVIVTERPRLALRQPRSLQPEQLRNFTVSTPADPERVTAWVIWEDGVEELMQAHAVAWTKRAVKVRFGAPPHQHEVWVWAGAVERA